MKKTLLLIALICIGCKDDELKNLQHKAKLVSEEVESIKKEFNTIQESNQNSEQNLTIVLNRLDPTKNLSNAYIKTAFFNSYTHISKEGFIDNLFDYFLKNSNEDNLNLGAFLTNNWDNADDNLWKYNKEPVCFHLATFSRSSKHLKYFFDDAIIKQVAFYIPKKEIYNELIKSMILAYERFDEEDLKSLPEIYEEAKNESSYTPELIHRIGSLSKISDELKNNNFDEIGLYTIESYIYLFWVRRDHEKNKEAVYTIMKKLYTIINDVNENDDEF